MCQRGLIDVHELWRTLEQVDQGIQRVILVKARHEEDVLPLGEKLIELAELPARLVQEENDLPGEALTLDRLPHGEDGRALDAHDQKDAAPRRVEDLLERGDPLRLHPLDAELADLREGMPPHAAGAVRGPIHGVVVNHDRAAVPRLADGELKEVSCLTAVLIQGPEGILERA